MMILFAGVISGVISAIIATLPSIKSSPDIPWTFMIVMVLSILLTGLAAIFLSVRSVSAYSLISSLKRE
jgi:ABC-type antimicrobial peptide transport system permease subunit